MTKVETERNNCIFALLLAQKGAVADVVTEEMNKSLAALISASHAEGVAEERERIRNAPDVTFVGGAAMNWHFDSRKWYIIPYSVLVPASVLAPKESEK
jgi:hypothetical protein